MVLEEYGTDTEPEIVSQDRLEKQYTAFIGYNGSNMQCDFPGCGHLGMAHNLCVGHYGQRRRDKPLTPLGSSYRKGCSVGGCKDKHVSRSFCAKHYSRWKKYGDPFVAQTPLVDRLANKINLDGPIPIKFPELGRCWIWTGGNHGGYGYTRGNTSQQRHASIVV